MPPKPRLLMALVVIMMLAAACANLSGEPDIVATIDPPTLVPPTQEAPPDRGAPLSAPDLANGAAIYAANCAACHGDTGRGDGPVALNTEGMTPTDFTDRATASEQTPHEWFRTITDGRIEKLMPPWGNTLSEQERWDVALYTYTMHYDSAMLQRGERIYQDCAECHGETGRGNGPEAFNSRIEVKDLTDFEAMVTLSDESIFRMVTQGFEDVMPSYAELSEDERRAVVAYARTLSLQNVPMPTETPAPTTSPDADTTSALTDIRVTALLVQVYAVGDTLDIVQTLRVRNLSQTQAFSQNLPLPGGGTAALGITLPEGAVITASAGISGASADGQTAYVIDPLAPYAEQLYVIGYSVPYTTGDLFTMPLDFVVEGPVRVLVRPLEMRLSSDLLTALGEETLGSMLYNAYGDQLSLSAGTSLGFRLNGTPDAPPPTPTPVPPPGLSGVVTSNVLLPLVIIAVVLLIIAVAVYALRTRTPSTEAQIMRIAREIGRIDAAHKAGTLNHDLWHQQRAALKAEQLRLRGYPENSDED